MACCNAFVTTGLFDFVSKTPFYTNSVDVAGDPEVFRVMTGCSVPSRWQSAVGFVALPLASAFMAVGLGSECRTAAASIVYGVVRVFC